MNLRKEKEKCELSYIHLEYEDELNVTLFRSRRDVMATRIREVEGFQ